MKEQCFQWLDIAETLPPLGHSVDYRTPTHHGFGYVDSTDRWMSFEGRLEPDVVLAWHEHRADAPVAAN